MFSPTNMPQSVSTLFSAYATFAGSVMLIRSMVNELIPYELRSYLSTAIHYLFTPLSPNITLVIDEHCGLSRNQVYDAAEIYLKTKISPSTERLKIGKTPRQRTFSVAIEKGEVVADVYENIKLKWAFVCTEPQNNSHSGEKKGFELSFNKKYKEKVMDCYLPHVLKRGKEIKDEEKVVKLYNREGSINLEHPSTFDTLALDPELKKMIVDDLKRFLGRKEFYKKVGKAWKRGYLLYGPPGTGKSSLIAAMANYLKFDIYDLELTSIYSNSDLRRVLLSTTNRSILVIEDIDCSMEMRDRQQGGDQYDGSNSRLTLSGLLNFIDGLWSSCGDERIIVFTTNHKDRLDPALLRPGRMDVHINMSYCTPQAFSILASNYLGIRDKNHYLYDEIEGLMESTNVTPAEVAEELMASENADVALEGLVNLLKLKRKHSEANEVKSEENGKVGDEEAKKLKTDVDEKKIVNKSINRNRILRAARGVSRRNCGRGMIPQKFCFL
ncbi:PREDICTED: probable mitochondrial chaperone BCS1-B isoform X2 [Populus euphratica]|uniref:Probable mitochondrial chaperone BCS1-B isoform X2 n=1 Tax=Populus euphratica TaxID=75702 RepID=A0AAJ6UAV9_POPEU|nr:PREDICTED: probable mitochondrial chaperone BCS1-B isoform X2 [Populus euphratica]